MLRFHILHDGLNKPHKVTLDVNDAKLTASEVGSNHIYNKVVTDEAHVVLSEECCKLRDLARKHVSAPIDTYPLEVGRIARGLL